ncbi:MAG: ribosome small subunit-dependent GTPase A [Planctomycetes bacterium]|nr:ribosome small subunit-dependent GTPase A [Planctomycetota bacterium]
MGEESGKYKGTKGPRGNSGLGRLRRAAGGGRGAERVGGIERRLEDDTFLEKMAPVRKASHTGEGLLAKFNRLAAEVPPEAAVAEALDGEVCGFPGALVAVRGADAREIPCQVRAGLKKRIAGVRNPLAVGDRVRWRDEPGGAVIVAVKPRTNQLSRADSHNRALIHVLAANVDAIVIVSSLAEPTLKPAFIDRYMILARACDVPAMVVINKADLGDASRVVEIYRALDLPVYTTSATRADDPEVARLRADLVGRSSVFAGQSGVGKSSLVNTLYPGLGARVGDVDASGLGRHTTTAARSWLVAGGGRVIDTPGIRECGIAGLTALDVALLYPDLARYQGACHFTDCTHVHEPGCAVAEAVEKGDIAFSRYDSYCAIVRDDLALGG